MSRESWSPSGSIRRSWVGCAGQPKRRDCLTSRWSIRSWRRRCGRRA